MSGPARLALPEGIAEQREQELRVQQQVMGLRNQIAQELFVQGLAENVDMPSVLQDQVPGQDIAKWAAFCLEASMIFLEVAGVIRRNPGALQ
jgi:hypothetical protein